MGGAMWVTRVGQPAAVRGPNDILLRRNGFAGLRHRGRSRPRADRTRALYWSPAPVADLVPIDQPGQPPLDGRNDSFMRIRILRSLDRAASPIAPCLG
jgi:hypothetical protein